LWERDAISHEIQGGRDLGASGFTRCEHGVPIRKCFATQHGDGQRRITQWQHFIKEGGLRFAISNNVYVSKSPVCELTRQLAVN
jgi:hypothetical protein